MFLEGWRNTAWQLIDIIWLKTTYLGPQLTGICVTTQRRTVSSNSRSPTAQVQQYSASLSWTFLRQPDSRPRPRHDGHHGCRGRGRQHPSATGIPGGKHWLPGVVRTNVVFTDGPQIPYILPYIALSAHMLPHVAQHLPRKLTMGSCGTSVMTPFVLTPSASCQGNL